jgi:hypothetical protein
VEEQGGRTLVRERADRLRQSPPPGLRSRCEALAREHCRQKTAAPWYLRLLPMSLVAAIVTVAALGLFSLATRRSSALLAAQLAVDHAKCFRIFDPAESSDARQVEADLRARYGWVMHVPASSAENGVQLVAGRRCLYADGTLPHVMYRAAGAAPVSLFRLDGVTREESEVTTMGYRCRIWSRGGNTYALVMPVSAAADTRLVSYLRREAR